MNWDVNRDKQEAPLTLGTSLFAALLLGVAWVMPTFAEAADGIDGDGDELLLPLALGAVVIIGGLAYWRSRRARSREG